MKRIIEACKRAYKAIKFKEKPLFNEECKRTYKAIKSKGKPPQEKPPFDLDEFYKIVHKCDDNIEKYAQKLYWKRWCDTNSYLDNHMMSAADHQWYEENKIELRLIAHKP